MNKDNIEEVINDIREAEARADDIVRESYQQGKDIVLSAEAEADRQKKDTLESCKQDRRLALQRADEEAAKKREVILKKGEKAAGDLIAAKKDQIEEQADRLVEILLEKYIKTDK